MAPTWSIGFYTVCTKCGQHMPEPRRAVVTGLDHVEGRLRAFPHAFPLPAPQRATGLRRSRYPLSKACILRGGGAPKA